MKYSVRIATLFILLLALALPVPSQDGQATLLADASVLDVGASILGVVGRVEFESGVRRGLAAPGVPLTPQSRVRLYPGASLLLRRPDAPPIRVLGQGSWRVEDLLDLAAAQDESQLVLPAFEALIQLPESHRNELLDILRNSVASASDRESDLPDRVDALTRLSPEAVAIDLDPLLDLYRELQRHHEETILGIIERLGAVRDDVDSEARATLARAHLLIDHFAYAEALESLGRFLRGTHPTDDARQHALLLQAVGFLGLGNRGSARHFLRIAQELNPDSGIAVTAGFFLSRLP